MSAPLHVTDVLADETVPAPGVAACDARSGTRSASAEARSPKVARARRRAIVRDPPDEWSVALREQEVLGRRGVERVEERLRVLREPGRVREREGRAVVEARSLRRRLLERATV